jgi:GMP synthase (glutamine-hydrolysing)
MKKGRSEPPVEKHRRVATSGDIEVSTYLEIAETGGETAPVSETVSGERETIVVIDFGSQYSLLITRRIRECNVYCELVPYDAPWEQIAPLNPKGYVFSGGPASVYDTGAPLAQPYIYDSGLPILGICYGMQVLARQLGGRVGSASPERR